MGRRLLVAVALVVAGCGGPESATSSDGADPPPSTAAPSTGPATTAAEPAETSTTETSALDRIAAGELPLSADGELDIGALAAFVEQQRGARFTARPDVRFVTPEVFASAAAGRGFLTDLDVALLAMLDLVGPDFDATSFDPLAAGDPGGRCCPVRVIPSDEQLLTAGIVVHELTHLLDLTTVDDIPGPSGGVESNFRAGVVEGNASRVQEAFLANYDTSVEELRQRFPPRLEVPPGLDALLGFPYRQGTLLAQAIAGAGGEAAIDAALPELPRSAEQVLFPEAYLAGELPVEVDPPADDRGELVRFGPIGPHLLAVAIVEDGAVPATSEDLPPYLPRWVPSFLRRWAGDAYELRQIGAELCLAATVLMDDAAAADELAMALQTTVPELSVTVDGEATELRRCKPR